MIYSLSMMVRSLSLPLAVLLLAIGLLQWLPLAPPGYADAMIWASQGTAALAGGLAILFNQSRTLAIALMLLLMPWLLVEAQGSGPGAATALFAATWLIPLNLLVLVNLRERALLSGLGLLLASVLALQVMVLLVVTERQDLLTPMLSWWERSTGSVKWTDAGAGLQIFMLGAILLGWRLWKQSTPLNAGFLLIVIALAAAVYWRAAPNAMRIYLGAGGLILLLTMLLETQRIAYRDDLTGLPSRRALNLRLATLGRRYVIAMVDVDHFKKFNDRHGHEVGDQVLRVVARQLQKGGGGTAYRYGGEEFAIVFPGKTMAMALPRLEAIREAIADYPLVLRGQDRPRQKPGATSRPGARSRGQSRVRVTASIGVAERSDRLRKADEVIQAADKALYKAKKAGRNRVST